MVGLSGLNRELLPKPTGGLSASKPPRDSREHPGPLLIWAYTTVTPIFTVARKGYHVRIFSSLVHGAGFERTIYLDTRSEFEGAC
jgi:hypothetical protein